MPLLFILHRALQTRKRKLQKHSTNVCNRHAQSKKEQTCLPARVDACTMLAIIVLCQSDTLENFDQQCKAADNTENCRHGKAHERAGRRRRERKGFLGCFVADRVPNIGIEGSARCSVPATLARRDRASACGIDIGGVIERA